MVLLSYLLIVRYDQILNKEYIDVRLHFFLSGHLCTLIYPLVQYRVCYYIINNFFDATIMSEIRTLFYCLEPMISTIFIYQISKVLVGLIDINGYFCIEKIFKVD